MNGADDRLRDAAVPIDVRQGNATDACRAALGQLLAYRHFLYTNETRLLALFTEDVGAAYASFLVSCGVQAVWPDGGVWRGTSGAATRGLAEVSA